MANCDATHKAESKHKTTVEIDLQLIEQRLDAVEEQLGEEFTRPLRLLFASYLSILQILQEKKLSIDRLRRMLFGASTERTSNVVGQQDDRQSDANDSVADSAEGCHEPDGDAAGQPTKQPRRKGHGRIPASAYTGCRREVITHDAWQPGDDCPHCGDGTLYRLTEWASHVRLHGQPLVDGVVYQLERLRCGCCGKVETAELPAEAGSEKYDISVASTIAVWHYGEGMPWARIEQLQQAAGIPLPASVQWELVRDALASGPEAVYQQLLNDAAQGELLHIDDTTMQILEHAWGLKRGQPLREDDQDRRGIFTTGMLSSAAGRPPIGLYFTGPYHAGENLETLLKQRRAELDQPLQMCDALSRNMPEGLRTIIANCLSHARRNFVDVAKAFPDEVAYVLQALKTVYHVDAVARRFGASPELRHQLHQRLSKPVMEELKRWLERQLSERQTEPNSSLGQAIRYMLKHWERLTRFLELAGAPLDNNIVERALKLAIRYRKNSLFYRTQRGARVGDVYMSLIQTCLLSDVDPLAYLNRLQRNAERVKEAPSQWLPWNHHLQPDTS